MKKKLRVKRIIFCISILLVIFLLISPFIFIRINLIGDKKITLNYGEKYSEPGYKASVFNKNISKDIKVKDNIEKEEGSYEIVYSYKFLFYKIKRVRKIEVKDVESPKIELEKGEDYETTVNEKFVEPGYKATDNKDGDLTASVKVTGEVDIKTLGEYKLNYEVKDGSGNKTKVTRVVRVVKKKPSQMSIQEYTLDGWYSETKLKETKNYGNEYFDSITMVGDSNTMNMYLNGYLSGLRAWAIPCLHASTMHHWNINLYGLGLQMPLIKATEKYKPEKMILNLGVFGTTWIKQDEFITKSNEIIEKIKKASPETKLVLISIYPITQYGTNENNFSQDTINKYNFMILEIANKHGLKYLDVQEVLKDSSGYGNPNYYVGDGFHLTTYGHSIVKEYIKTHAID